MCREIKNQFESGEKIMVEVFVRGNDVEQALRRLKKVMNREGVFREMRERKHHEKPFERRQRALRDAVRRSQKEESKRRQDM